MPDKRSGMEEVGPDGGNKYKQLFEQSPVGMCLTGLNGILLEVNEPFCDILGYAKHELEGKHYNMITHPEDQGLGEDFVGRVISGEIQKGSFRKRYLAKNGNSVWVNIWSAVVRDAENNATHFITQVEDITLQRQAEEQLMYSEERFSKAFNLGPSGITITRISDGKFLDVNQYFLELFEFTQDEVIGKTSTEINLWTAEERKKIIEAQVKAGGLRSAELQARSKSGMPVHILFSSKPIVLQNEECLITSMIDISEKKKVEAELIETERRYRTLFQNMNNGFVLFEVMLDDKGTPVDLYILDANQGFETTTGLSLRDAAGERLTHVLPGIEEDDADWIGTYSKIALHGGSVQFEQKSELLNKYFSISAFNIGPKHCAVTFADISDRRKAELEIKEMNEFLGIKVKQRTSELEKANSELEAFTYSVSHDLRAPLRAIDGFSKFLAEDYGEKLNEEGMRLIRVIRTNVSRMDQLIRDLLQLSRINKIHVNVSGVDMFELVQMVIEEILSEEHKNSFDIDVKALPRVPGDYNLLWLVWVNLISNAVKYSAPSEIKKIVIDYSRKDDFYIFSIMDKGVGFNDLYKAKLFGIFERLHSMDEFDGTGVGLAIVQRIILAHGGEVWAEGQMNKGATFYFSLPRKANKHA